MQLAKIVGHAVATLKHSSMNGWRLAVAQCLTANEQPDGEPILVIDSLGAGTGTRVLLCNDGKGAAELTGSKNTPVRWFVMGICEA